MDTWLFLDTVHIYTLDVDMGNNIIARSLLVVGDVWKAKVNPEKNRF